MSLIPLFWIINVTVNDGKCLCVLFLFLTLLTNTLSQKNKQKLFTSSFSFYLCTLGVLTQNNDNIVVSNIYVSCFFKEKKFY